MIKLYRDSDFILLQNWVTDAELLLQFSGTDFTYPITIQQISNYQKENPARCFYIGYSSENNPYAFGEIISQKTGVPRLGRILIGDPAVRGKGMGRYFITLLIDECRRRFQTDRVELFTSHLNHNAIRCYESAGFIFNPVKEKTLMYQDRSFNIHKMTYYHK
ncbi:MAG: GNAT family N-acetyltransferase [Sphingobacteriaceae bacterium]|nr:GNAT family N-acetyltransferase [Sphingobacteriaceae bacterium]